ncbi:MAG: class I SAM-dependent methyltransferase [Opitutales bacterium]
MQPENEPVKPHQALPEYYDSDSEKPLYLNELFNTSGARYDRILKYGFFGTGGNYRLRALRKAGLTPDMRVLDVACGTGGVLEQAAKIVSLDQVIGLDPSSGMLEVARRKFPAATFWEGSAESIPCEAETFDFLVMGYALRHVKTLDEAFQEYYRVLKPGGKVLILEISRPRSRLGYLFARLYLRHFIPLLALLLCRNREAPKMMRYFWDSINACASREAVLDSLSRSGFQECGNTPELGAFSAFSGVKPGR